MKYQKMPLRNSQSIPSGSIPKNEAFHCDPMTIFAKSKRRAHYSERFSRHLYPLIRALRTGLETISFRIGAVHIPNLS